MRTGLHGWRRKCGRTLYSASGSVRWSSETVCAKHACASCWGSSLHTVWRKKMRVLFTSIMMMMQRVS